MQKYHRVDTKDVVHLSPTRNTYWYPNTLHLVDWELAYACQASYVVW